MADANVRLTADTSLLNSGIKETLNLMNQLKQSQDSSNNKIDESINKEVNARKKGTEQLKKQNEEIKKELGLIERLEKELLDLDQARRKSNNVDDIKKYNDQLKKTENELNKVSTATNKVTNNTKKVGLLGKAFGSLKTQIGGLFATFGAIAIVRNSINTIREFELQNATLAGVLGVTREETQKLTESQIEYGSTTQFTAQEVGQLQEAYARLGFTQSEILDVTKATLDGSVALGSGLAETAELVGGVLNSFQKDTEDTANVVNVLTNATQTSALNFDKLNTALPIVGTTSRLAGVSLEKTSALLGVLSNNNIDASTSATALRNIFLEISKRGLSYDEALDKISNSTDKLKTANELFGTRGAGIASILAETRGEVDELTNSYENVGNVAEELANEKLNTLDGSIKLLLSAWDGFILKMNDVTGTGNILTKTIGFLANNLELILKSVGAGIGLFTTYRVTVFALNKGFAIYQAGVKAVAVAQALFNGGIKKGIAQMKIFNAVTKLNPIGLLITALTGAIALFKIYNKNLSESEKLQQQVNKTRNKALKSVADEKASLDTLIQTAKNENLTKEQRIEAIEKLNKLSPEYLGNITLENINTNATTKAINNYIKALDRKALAQAVQERKAEIFREILEEEGRTVEENTSLWDEFTIGLANTFENQETLNKELAKSSELQKSTNIDKLKAESQALDELIQNKIENNELDLGGVTGVGEPTEDSVGLIKDINNRIKEEQASLNRATTISEIRQIQSRIKRLKKEKYDILGIKREENKGTENLLKERNKIFENADKNLEKLDKDLQTKRVESFSISEAEKIRISEQNQLKDVDNLKNNILEQQGILDFQANTNEQFLKTASNEEIEIEKKKYIEKAKLTESQEEAIRDLRKNIFNKTQQELFELSIRQQQEIISLSEESTTKRLQLQEQLELSSIEKVKNDITKSEEQKEIEILDIRTKFLEQKKALIEEETRLKNEQINKEIELLKSLNTEESNLKIQSLEVQKDINNQQLNDQIQSYDNQIEAGKQAVIEAQQVAEQSTLDNAIGKIFGVDSPEQIQAIKDTFKTLVDNLVSIYSQGLQRQLESNERLIDGINQRIDEQENAIDREIDKNEEGNASSIALEESKLDELKAQREQALAEQEELVKKQQQLEDLQQIASLVTASANIFKSLSPGFPATLPLAVGSVALMFGAFAKTKSDAKNSVELAEGGTIKAGDNKVIQGKRHSQGGEDFLKHVEMEQGEMVSVFNRKATSNFGKEIVNFANMVNSGKKPILPNGEVVRNLQDKESNLSINLNSKFDSKELKENNKKMDKLIDLLSNQAQYSENDKSSIVRKGITTKRYRK